MLYSLYNVYKKMNQLKNDEVLPRFTFARKCNFESDGFFRITYPNYENKNKKQNPSVIIEI